MHVIKPAQVALCTRAIEHRKRFGFCITQMLMAPIAETPSLLQEQTLWNFVAALPAPPLLDEGVVKLTPEFLVHGHAYPSNAERNAAAVRVRLGGIEKRLIAFGERYWDGGRPSVPAPFEKIPLGWERAYGGPDFAPNPAGMGRVQQEGLAWLPHFEAPDDRMIDRARPVRPAGFSALDTMHPQRAAWRGTYDADYLQQHSPGFAPDIDWRYFNMAPQDQWLGAPLTGDELFELDHLHPQQARIAGRLPGLRTRSFVNYRLAGGAHKLKEVPMRLTTVWFFPEALQTVLVFHGMAEVGEHDGSDIAHLVCAVERLQERRSDEHYGAVIDRRLDPAWGTVASLDDAPLLPEGLSTFDPAREAAEAPFAIDGLQASAQRRRAEIEMTLAREQARELGRDPDALGLVLPPPEPTPTIAQLPAYLEAKAREMEAQQCIAAEQMADHLLKAIEHAETHKIDLAKLVHRGPPLYRAETQLAALQAQYAGRTGFDEAAIAPKLALKERAERLGYLQSAHMQPPAWRAAPEAAAETRREVQWMLAHGLRVLPGIDLTGADLSGLDLRGIDFSGGWFESADLRGANLSGAHFNGAVLAHADLGGAIAIGTDFTRANLGRARFDDAVFDQALLADATLTYAAFARTQLRRAVFKNTDLLHTTWVDVDATEISAPGQLFYRLDLRGLRLDGADLASANFIECDLSGGRLPAARLEGTSFVSCRMVHANLEGARARGLVLTRTAEVPSSGEGLVATGADLRGANLGDCDLQGARLARALLDGANLGFARLDGADLRLASAKGALLRKTRLREAQLAGANLKEALLPYADLRSADLRESNLYGADLSRVRLDGSTRFDAALTERARTWPRLTPQQQAAADAAELAEAQRDALAVQGPPA